MRVCQHVIPHIQYPISRPKPFALVTHGLDWAWHVGQSQQLSHSQHSYRSRKPLYLTGCALRAVPIMVWQWSLSSGGETGLALPFPHRRVVNRVILPTVLNTSCLLGKLVKVTLWNLPAPYACLSEHTEGHHSCTSNHIISFGYLSCRTKNNFMNIHVGGTYFKENMWCDLSETIITTRGAFAFLTPVQTDKTLTIKQQCQNVNIKSWRALEPSLDEECVRERGVGALMTILQINSLCHANEMMQCMTAIGCSIEECSLAANAFCYQRLAAGKAIKKWKPTRGTGPWNQFYVAHFARPSERREMWLSVRWPHELH